MCIVVHRKRREAAGVAAIGLERWRDVYRTVHAVGAEELLAHIAGIQSKHPGACILRTSNVDVHHGVARFAWKFVMPDGSSLPEGLDIAFLDEEQKRITRIIGFFGLLKPVRPLAEGGVS
ncbi:hypothetical protein [Mesorhizobium sp. M0011]|uniref:hypothetical protein n=1 Tax=Mesorhizobium sp. M0011 TaxID=2956839 RepID=UPI00333530D2